MVEGSGFTGFRDYVYGSTIATSSVVVVVVVIVVVVVVV